MSKIYYINVKFLNLKDFYQIIKFLKNFGIIDLFGLVGELVREGLLIFIEDLILVLEYLR